MISFAERVDRYVDDVLSGRKLACQWVQKACQRQRDDLAKQETEQFPYVWQPPMVEHVCEFLEKLPHIKGKWAREGKTLELEDWQVFVVGVYFGWYEPTTELRRFRICFVLVPRKNAKSTLSSGVALYALLMDNEPGAEIYSAATTADQARIVWADAKRMVDKLPDLREATGVRAMAHSIFVESTASHFKPLSADASTHDGLNIHCSIIDEVHAHPKRDLIEVLETATGAREHPIQWEISTAGSNRHGICYEHQLYLQKILDGTADDETFFGVVYTIDDADDWTDPNVWEKANPNYGVSVSPDDLARKCNKAKKMASAQPGFLTKHLDVWVNADSAWLDVRAWDRCRRDDLSIDDFEGEPCRISLDLSSKLDLAAKGYHFKRQEEINGRIQEIHYLFAKFWLPEETIVNSPNSDLYYAWEQAGFLEATRGLIIDMDEIEESLREDHRRFEIIEVPYDPFQATQLAGHMIEEGFPMLEVGATVKNFSEPMKLLESLIIDGKVRHDGNPTLGWCMGNVVCHVDKKDNVFPNKNHEALKIDGAVSLIMLFNRHIADDDGYLDLASLV